MDLDALTSGGVIPLSWILNNDHEVIMKFRGRFNDDEWLLFVAGNCCYQQSWNVFDSDAYCKKTRRVAYVFCQQHPGNGNLHVPHQISGLSEDELHKMS